MSKINIGILGLGSRSTTYYLSELNKKYNQLKGSYSTCPLLLLNADFNSINSLLPYASIELDKAVNEYVTQLETFDIEHILVPNITLHETIDRLKISKNIIHPIHLTIQKINDLNCNKVVIFGSLFSMKSPYIKSFFIENNINVLTPTEEDMKTIDEVRKHIYHETESPELIKKYLSIIAKYSEENPVILSCTELSILKGRGNKNVIDMVEIQIENAVKTC